MDEKNGEKLGKLQWMKYFYLILRENNDSSADVGKKKLKKKNSKECNI